MSYILQANPKTIEEAQQLILNAKNEIHSFVLKILGKNHNLSEEDIEDIVSVCWFKVYESIPAWYDPTKSRIETPIYQKVYWLVNNFVTRTKTIEVNLENCEPVRNRAVPDKAWQDLEENRLFNLLEDNCNKDGSIIQQILYYRYKENKPWQEVGQITGQSHANAVKLAEEWFKENVE